MTTICLNIIQSGYTQTRKRVNGIIKLREKLIKQSYSNGVSNRVWYLTWDACVVDVAEDIINLREMYSAHTHINMCGYSYGGWGILQLCDELWKRRVDVENLILCDPVGRPKWWPKPLPAATSMIRRDWAPRLTVPPNVHELYSFFQMENRPQGHLLKTHRTTQVNSPKQLFVPHDEMDDVEVFHDLFLSLAEKSRCAHSSL